MDAVDEQMQGALAELRREVADGPLSLFIDPTIHDPMERLRDEVGSAAWDREWLQARRVPLPPIHDDFDPQRRPYLIHFPSERAAEHLVQAAIGIAIEESLGAATAGVSGRTVCGVLPGDCTPDTTATRLANTARIQRPDGRPWYLRFWDPRVLWHLPRVMPNELWRHIAGGIGPWLALSPGRGIRNVTASGVGDRREDKGRPMHVDQPLWDRLALIGPINQVLGSVAWWGLDPSPIQAQRIEDLLLRAQSWGCPPDGDGIIFAVTALVSCDEFDRHPAVKEALGRKVREGLPLAVALADFDDAFWTSLSEGGPSDANTKDKRPADRRPVPT